MINTMENFDIYDAEDYFISFKSFKGTDILEWINTHLDSDITDEKIFAKFSSWTAFSKYFSSVSNKSW